MKDYILSAEHDLRGGYEFRGLVTRDQRGFLWSVWLTFAAVVQIWHAHFSGRLAFVHVNFGDKASAARKGSVVLLSRLVGAAVVLHLHAVQLHHQYARASAATRWLIRLPFKCATCCIVLGEVWRTWVTDDLGISSTKVRVVINGVPVRIGAVRPSIQPRVVNILFLGNLMARKGVGDLLSAVARLPAGTPAWKLTLAGGGELDYYKGVAATLNLGIEVEFAGWVNQSDARRLLASTDLLVLPSYDEGLPLVILEALGSGAPVLCTPVGSIPEVLTDGEDAIFSRVGDPDDLAAHLAQLISDPRLRSILSRAGVSAYRQKFSLQAFLDSLFTVYREQLRLDIEPPVLSTPPND